MLEPLNAVWIFSWCSTTTSLCIVVERRQYFSLFDEYLCNKENWRILDISKEIIVLDWYKYVWVISNTLLLIIILYVLSLKWKINVSFWLCSIASRETSIKSWPVPEKVNARCTETINESIDSRQSFRAFRCGCEGCSCFMH